jgi:hypothetical protein
MDRRYTAAVEFRPAVAIPEQEKEMRTVFTRLSLTGVIAIVVGLTAFAADEKKPEKIAFAKAPKAIQAAINGRFPGANVTGLTKETENGKVVFDVELKHKGRKFEMDILENGTIVEIEKEVALKDAPKALAATVVAKYPKAKIKEIMEVNKVKGKTETPDHYEVTITTAGKKSKEILVTLDGKSMKSEED